MTFRKYAIDEVPTPFPEPGTPGVTVLGYDDPARAILAVIDTTVAKTPDCMSWLQRRFGTEITTRTWLTVQRILAKIPAAEQ